VTGARSRITDEFRDDVRTFVVDHSIDHSVEVAPFGAASTALCLGVRIRLMFEGKPSRGRGIPSHPEWGFFR
jgi:hypothetical protein